MQTPRSSAPAILPHARHCFEQHRLERQAVVKRGLVHEASASAPRARISVARIALSCVVFASALPVLGGGCGATGIEAPRVVGAHEDIGCASADEVLANTREALSTKGEGRVLEELRPTLERVLVDDGGLRVLIRAFSTAIVEVDATALTDLLGLLDPRAGFGELTPHLVNVLRYIDGSSPWTTKPHLEPVAAVHSILTQCDAATMAATVEGLLALEVTRAPDGVTLAEPGTGDGIWLAEVLVRARAALDEPELRTLLSRISLEDPDSPAGPGQLRVGRDAFLLLARLLAANLAAPEFDPNFTLDLVDGVLISRVQDEDARNRLLELTDLVLLVTQPNADVFPRVQDLMRCMNVADADAAIPGLMYDLLTVEELSVSAILDDLLGATAGPVAGALRRAAIDVVGVAASNPSMTSDVARVLAAFVDARTAPILIRTVIRLQGRGVLLELTSLADALASCRVDEREP